jgi:uncharacterized protein YcbK (DUF882 family)
MSTFTPDIRDTYSAILEVSLKENNTQRAINEYDLHLAREKAQMESWKKNTQITTTSSTSTSKGVFASFADFVNNKLEDLQEIVRTYIDNEISETEPTFEEKVAETKSRIQAERHIREDPGYEC